MYTYLRISFFIIILSFSSIFANPNTDLQDVSPTHLQLFQLSQFAEDVPQSWGTIYRESEVLNSEIQNFITNSTANYAAFIATHHQSGNQAQDYTSSAEKLIDAMHPIRTMNIEKYPLSIVLQNHKALLLNIIEQEIQAAKEGKCIFWRYEYQYENSENYILEKSFSAPGILAGVLYDGFTAYLNPGSEGAQSGGACTFVYAANVQMKRLLNRAPGYAYLHQHTQKILEKLGCNASEVVAPALPSDLKSCDTHIIQWKNANLEILTKLFESNIAQYPTNMLFKGPFHFLRRKNMDLSGRLYGVQIQGTYKKNEIETLCPAMLAPSKGIFGIGEAFHPKVKERELTNAEFLEIDLDKLDVTPVCLAEHIKLKTN